MHLAKHNAVTKSFICTSTTSSVIGGAILDDPLYPLDTYFQFKRISKGILKPHANGVFMQTLCYKNSVLLRLLMRLVFIALSSTKKLSSYFVLLTTLLL